METLIPHHSKYLWGLVHRAGKCLMEEMKLDVSISFDVLYFQNKDLFQLKREVEFGSSQQLTGWGQVQNSTQVLCEELAHSKAAAESLVQGASSFSERKMSRSNQASPEEGGLVNGKHQGIWTVPQVQWAPRPGQPHSKKDPPRPHAGNC